MSAVYSSVIMSWADRVGGYFVLSLVMISIKCMQEEPWHPFLMEDDEDEEKCTHSSAAVRLFGVGSVNEEAGWPVLVRGSLFWSSSFFQCRLIAVRFTLHNFVVVTSCYSADRQQGGVTNCMISYQQKPLTCMFGLQKGCMHNDVFWSTDKEKNTGETLDCCTFSAMSSSGASTSSTCVLRSDLLSCQSRQRRWPVSEPMELCLRRVHT